MAIILEAAYSKKLGLPNYSSHSYVVSVRTELQDLNQVPAESAKLYQMLQAAVDKEIQEPGFLPDPVSYGMSEQNTNGNGTHHKVPPTRSNGPSNGRLRDGIPITPKQLALVNKIVQDNGLDKNDVEQMAVDMFGDGVKQLNMMQASNLIDELFERHGRSNGHKRPQMDTNRARR